MKSLIICVLRVLLFSVLAAGTLIALFYAEEDWRGARIWAAARRDLQARGESLDFRDFVPRPIPDGENLAMAPLFVRALQYRTDPATSQLIFGDRQDPESNTTLKTIGEMPFGKQTPNNSPMVGRGNWATGHAIDFGRLQRYCLGRKDFPEVTGSQLPAESAALVLRRYAPLLDELDQALASRPGCRFPVPYGRRPVWSIRLPHFNLIRQLTTKLSLRASADLACGRKTPALHDIGTALALRRATAYDPSIIGGLVDSTDLVSLLQPVWEGLAARQWSADDLDHLRSDLGGVDVLAGYLRGMRGGERAMFCVELIEDLRLKGNIWEFAKMMSVLSSDYSGGANWYQSHLIYVPQGWYEENAALTCQLQQQYLIDPVHEAKRYVSIAAARELEPVLEKLPVRPDTFMTKWLLPTFNSLIGKFAQTQAAVNHAIVACALEKYYLAHQTYPRVLDALVPGYLEHAPIDVIDGRPMHYRRTVDGRYQLYSVGWDGEDGGGVLEWKPDRTWRSADRGKVEPDTENFPAPITYRGDWVWQYAPAEPPDPPLNQSRLEGLPPDVPQ